MATIGAKEAQRKAMREANAKNQTTRAMVAAVDGPKKAHHVPGQANTFSLTAKPPAAPATKESSVSKKAKKKPAPKAKAKPAPKAKVAAAKSAKKIAAAKGVDRSPLTVGTFITRDGGCTMAELEKTFKMDAHPLRSKIHAAKHKLGFTIKYDAKEKRYSGHAPRDQGAPA